MQVARYWRMKTQTYRLQGTRLPDGSMSIQDRPVNEAKPVQPETPVAVKA